ncbi:hypothetical protein [Xiamenia xianingshaonis]|uniref:Polymer-forming cytoskeletal protein n=1 Tax=Xiamenia xianingshaonis TaxID=2682776 RepID=A0ABX0IG98_9ACTN|nr:hypothetical protein [Xiamenia xianingshaonis]NHM13640.1 hypothetical protein [Xiamenia xianingshaonis]
MEKTGLRTRGIAHAAMAFFFAMLLTFSTAGAAWAAPSDEAKDSAGNAFASSEDYTSPSENKIDRDFYWAGKDLDLASTETGGDIVIAGMNLGVSDSKAAGNIRAAGMNLTFTNVSSGSNFTVAGQDINLVDCAAEGGVYCAGSTISFAGSASAGSFAAGKVVFNGTINGDASIYADAVEIGPDAVVTGTLHVESGVEPVVPESAQIGALEFEKAVDDTSVNANEAAEIVTFIDVLMKVLGIVGTILFALALAWLFRRPVEGAAAMTRSHAGRIFATGAIALVASPLLFVLLLCLVVTSSIAVALLFALVVLAMVAVPFAAASLSRLVLPKMNRFGAAAIGGVVLGIVSILPFLGVLVSLASFIYLLGYVIQAVWNARRSSPDDAAPNEPSNGPSEAGAPAVLGSPVVTLPSENKGDGPQHAADQQRQI